MKRPMIVTLLCLGLCAQSAAAPGRWLAPGGDPAGSARSHARALLQEPEVAWTWSSPASIEGEVSVWDGRALLGLSESSGRRGLVLLDLEDGSVLLQQTLRASIPLSPSMDGDAICVRPSAERVDVYRLRDGRIGRPRAIRAERSISAPLLVEGELYLRLDDSLQRFDLDSSEPTWRAQLPGVVRGRPALLGDRVFTLFYAADGSAHVAILERKSGRLLASKGAGSHGGQIPALDAPARLYPSEHRVFVQYPLEVRTQAGARFAFGSLALEGAHFAPAPASLHNYRFEPLMYESGWLAFEADASRSWQRVALESERWIATVLADKSTQPQLAASNAPAALAGDVIYFGGLAADLVSERILWKRAPALFRPTPIDNGLLVIEEPHTLSALRAPSALRSSAEASTEAHIQRLEAERASKLAELAQRSIRIGDARLTRRLIDEAQRLGARARELDPAFRALDRIADNSKPANTAGNLYRAMLEEEQDLHREPALALAALAAPEDGELQRALLRAALLRDPDLEQAKAEVRALLPEGAQALSSFAALSWLDFLDVAARIPVRLVGLDSAPAERLALAEERDGWRPDLSGFRSERLLIIAPTDQPGAVARCLETGELLADLLEQTFGTERPAGAAPLAPMLLLLYPTRDEYISQSTKAHSAPEQVFGWTAGHYSATDNRSRLFVPQNDSAREELLEVYAHELTHHWLATRSPFASRSGAVEAPFWIVEGFATLISEFQLDPSAHTWQARNPRAGSLDTLKAIPPESLLPWSSVLGLDHTGFTRLSRTAHLSVPLAWTLGLHTSLSVTQLFYTQASAMAQALYNGSPQSRQQLLDYVRAWYTQDLPQMDVQAAFGANAERLGQRALEYSKRN